MLNVLISPGEGVRLQTRGNFLVLFRKSLVLLTNLLAYP